ncbi:MAG TPA: MFS transporter [archaeon]|nr:MFS transporter [archaeon]
MLKPPEKILLYSSNLWYLSAGMLGPLIAVFTEQVGGSLLDISWAWAIYLIFTGLFIIITGKISDKILGKEKLLILGYWLSAVFTFSYLLVNSTLDLFVVQAGFGIATALATPTWDALYAKYEDKKHDGYTWGLATGEATIINGIAVVIGGLIVTYFSFNYLFATMGIIMSIAAAYQTKIIKYRKTKKRRYYKKK